MYACKKNVFVCISKERGVINMSTTALKDYGFEMFKYVDNMRSLRHNHFSRPYGDGFREHQFLVGIF